VHVGGVLFLVILSAIIGLVWMLFSQRSHRGFFHGEMSRYSLTDDDELVELKVGSDPTASPR
jgi:hypothetical protein